MMYYAAHRVICLRPREPGAEESDVHYVGWFITALVILEPFCFSYKSCGCHVVLPSINATNISTKYDDQLTMICRVLSSIHPQTLIICVYQQVDKLIRLYRCCPLVINPAVDPAAIQNSRGGKTKKKKPGRFLAPTRATFYRFLFS